MQRVTRNEHKSEDFVKRDGHCTCRSNPCFVPTGNGAHLAIALVLYDERIVIPRALRLELLDSVHRGHFGINRCRARAGMSVWWKKNFDRLHQVQGLPELTTANRSHEELIGTLTRRRRRRRQLECHFKI